MTREELLALRRPARFAAWALGTGTFGRALAAVALAMVFSILGAYRLGSTVNVEDFAFGPSRNVTIDALISAIGIERTAVLVYMMQRSFAALVVASALTPIFFWLLGSSAMHAAARIRGLRGRAYLPMLVLFAYAALVYQAPTSVAALAFGPLGEGAGSQLANAVSLAMLAWFAFVVYRGIEQHYGVSGERAMLIFVIGGLVFYLLPFVLIIGTLVGLVVTAALLQYF